MARSGQYVILKMVLKTDQTQKELLETAKLAISEGMLPDMIFDLRGLYAYLTVLSKEECLSQIDKLLQKNLILKGETNNSGFR